MTSVIKILPSNLINQIAAGEVIERPSAVVKELVENAIDAGANNIKITLYNGGKSFISVEDNGVGIAREDLKICLFAHTTSKLPTENLFEINTLGFRGEALASIASISKITVASKYYASDDAYEIYAANGVINEIKPSNVQEGTIIKVRDIFFSIPARLKFLRNDNTEAANCFSVIKRLAISNPRVSFKVEHNDKVVIDYTTLDVNSMGVNYSDYGVDDLKADVIKEAIETTSIEDESNHVQQLGAVDTTNLMEQLGSEEVVNESQAINNTTKVDAFNKVRAISDKAVIANRIQQIFGKDFLKNSVYVEENNPVINIKGFLAVPTYSQNHSNNQFIMLNDRSLKDKNLSYLIKLGYGDSLVKGRQPCYVLFINIDNREVDVNVNPTKSEVRFKDVNLVKHVLLNLVKNNVLSKNIQSNDSNIARQLLNKSYDKTYQEVNPSFETKNVRQLSLGAYNINSQNSSFNKNSASLSRVEMQDYHQAIINESNINETTLINQILKSQDSDNYSEQNDLSNNAMQHSNNFIVAENNVSFGENYQEGENKSNYNQSSDKNFILEEEKVFINSKDDNTASSSLDNKINPTNIADFNDETSVDDAIIKNYPLGFAKAQFHKNWIVAQTNEGLIIVDQHAAHERITHENLKLQFYSQKILKQMLLIPEIITVRVEELAALKAYKNEINSLGIVFEITAEDTVAITEIPAIIAGGNIVKLIQDLIEDLIALDNIESFHKEINAILARIACHGSIRSGKILRINEMNSLLRTMEKTKAYAQCSHGRPTFIKISLKDLESLFGR